ncbi:MAG TPA: hypothetical protein VGM92_06925 [Candidatus Kapabacteria bacterium]
MYDTTGGSGTSIDTEYLSDSVIANNTIWNGRSTSFLTVQHRDTSGIIIESNGDVSIYLGPTAIDLQDVSSKNMVDFGWIRLPVGSHTNSVLRTIDTTLQDVPNGTAHVVLSVSYLETGSVTVGSVSLPVSVVRYTLQKTLSDGSQIITSVDQEDISYSSTIGYFAMIKFLHSTIPNTADENDAGTGILSSYTLK